MRGTVAADLLGALEEIEATAEGTRCRKPFYHASISPSPAHPMTAAQWRYAIDRLEVALRLKGQPRTVVAHVKRKREHVHVVWSRIDAERGRAISDSWNFLHHEMVARNLEREFGHKTVRGAFTVRDQQPRPKRTARLYELRQKERSGIRHTDIQAEVTALWHATTTGEQFRKRLDDAGYVLARGDRRTFVIVDAAGEVHALARRVNGARSRDIQARLGNLSMATLPNVSEAVATTRERASYLKREFERTAPNPNSLTTKPAMMEEARESVRRLAFRSIGLTHKASVAVSYFGDMMRLWQSRRTDRWVTTPNTLNAKRASKRAPTANGGKRKSYVRRSTARRTSTYAQERGAILLLYASKIAAAQLYCPHDHVAAVVNALKAEQRAALEALYQREATEIETQRKRRLLADLSFAARDVSRRTTPPRLKPTRTPRYELLKPPAPKR